jgi:hypothetical protein
MKTLRLLKVISLLSFLLMAMAFSCQDHHIPDPDPVANCNRVDGTARAFPCEFEITKLEFLKTTTGQVSRTVLPGNLNVQLPIGDAYHFQYGSQRAYAIVEFRVRLHIKRIAKASFPPVGGYELIRYQLSPPVPIYGSLYNDILTEKGNEWMTPPSPAGNPITLDMAVGETRTVASEVYFILDLTPTSSHFLGQINFSIGNNSTARTLIAAPYNYDLVRDAYEATIGFIPAI